MENSLHKGLTRPQIQFYNEMMVKILTILKKMKGFPRYEGYPYLDDDHCAKLESVELTTPSYPAWLNTNVI